MLAGYVNSPVTAGRGNVFAATAIVTAPGIFSTAAGTGGPLLYNPSGSGVTAYLLAVSLGVTVASTVAGAIGLTGGASTAPSSTTAIDSVVCTKLHTSPPSPKCNIYRIGTVSAPGGFFWPIGQIGTNALTALPASEPISLGGVWEIDYGYFLAVAGSAVLSTTVAQISIMWLEVPKN